MHLPAHHFPPCPNILHKGSFPGIVPKGNIVQIDTQDPLINKPGRRPDPGPLFFPSAGDRRALAMPKWKGQGAFDQKSAAKRDPSCYRMKRLHNGSGHWFYGRRFRLDFSAFLCKGVQAFTQPNDLHILITLLQRLRADSNRREKFCRLLPHRSDT